MPDVSHVNTGSYKWTKEHLRCANSILPEHQELQMDRGASGSAFGVASQQMPGEVCWSVMSRCSAHTRWWPQMVPSENHGLGHESACHPELWPGTIAQGGRSWLSQVNAGRSQSFSIDQVLCTAGWCRHQRLGPPSCLLCAAACRAAHCCGETGILSDPQRPAQSRIIQTQRHGLAGM